MLIGSHNFDPKTHRYNVMVSSTFRDLVNLRANAREVILKCGMFPIGMETDSANPDNILTTSLKMVGDTDVYIAILGARYGQIFMDPRNPQQLSMTELEYNHAQNQGKMIYIFFYSEDSDSYRLQAAQETPRDRKKLNDFKKRLKLQHSVREVDLTSIQGEISVVLNNFRAEQVERARDEEKAFTAQLGAKRRSTLYSPFGGHSSSNESFVGRNDDLAILDSWGASNDMDSTRVLMIDAMGGMGKSTLAWQWATNPNHAKRLMSPAGIVWWNFYNPNATMKEFVRHTLAYVTEQPVDTFPMLRIHDLVDTLFQLLRRENYLIIMDGLERILIEYRDPDNPQTKDDQIPEDKWRRNCLDPLFDGRVLEELTNCHPTKLLVTTRLVPTAFERRNGLLPTIKRHQLLGLSTPDAIHLANRQGIARADRNDLSDFLAQFDNHPLVITIIAGLVSENLRAPGNFDDWYAHVGKEVNLADIDIKQRRTMIFDFALRDMSEFQYQTLAQVAAFSGPVSGEDLYKLNPYLPAEPPRPKLPLLPHIHPNPLDLTINDEQRTVIASERNRRSVEWNRVVAERARILRHWRNSPEVNPPDAQQNFTIDVNLLVSRGLLWRNKQDHTYDLHPLLRRYVNDTLPTTLRLKVVANVRKVYGSTAPSASQKARSMRELRPYIEFYRSMVRDHEYERAASLFNTHLSDPLFKWGEYPQVITLLKDLFTANEDVELPSSFKLDDIHMEANIRHNLARALENIGELERSQNQHSANIALAIKLDKHDYLVVALICYARIQRREGRFVDWYKCLELAQDVAQETRDDKWISSLEEEVLLFLVITGQFQEANRLQRSRKEPEEFTRFRDKYDEVLFYLRKLIHQLSNEEDVLEVYQRLRDLTIPSYGQNAEVQYWLAHIEYQNGHFSEALQRIDGVVRLLKQSSMATGHALALRAQILISLGNTDEAEFSLRTALDDRNRDRIELANLLNSAASAQLDLGRVEDAKVLVQEALTVAYAQGSPYTYWLGVQNGSNLAQRLEISIPPLPNYHPLDANALSIPHEAEVRAYIESKSDSKQFNSAKNPQTPSDIDELYGITWTQIGVIAYYGVTDEVAPILVDMATKMYSLCNNPGPVDPTTSDELVDPQSTRNGEPIDHGIERMLLDEIRQDVNPISLANISGKHDGICVVFLQATDAGGSLVHVFMSLRVEKLVWFFEEIQMKGHIKISDFGRAIHVCNTWPTRDDLDMMFDNWLFVSTYLPVKLIARRAGE